jgi:hypothetical protein
MREQAFWYWPGLIPLCSGLAWLVAGTLHGWGLLLALVPGLVHTAAGTGLLLWPGDRRIPQCLAGSAYVAAALAVPAGFVLGGPWALALLALALASYGVAGHAALQHEPLTPGVPPPAITPGLMLKVALDEGFFCCFPLGACVLTAGRSRLMQIECERIRTQYRDRDLRSFHRAPGSPQNLQLRPRRLYGQDYQHLSFDSGYQPWEDDPGAQAWQAQARNRRAHAWVLQHPGPPRPWLVCIHGYRMGMPVLDFLLFRPRWLHHRLGLNLLLPVLPLHGPRREGLRSGDGYLDGDFPNFIHAEAQAMHDIRSLIGWLRDAQQAPAVGAFGYSLGGYNAALLSCLEERLDCVIAGIPMTDIAATLWRHMPQLQLRYLESLGLTQEVAREALRVISPLAIPPRTARRYIFAGTVDRLIPPAQVLTLARHWQLPQGPVWYPGTHLSFRGEPAVSALILRALRESGLTAG